MSAKLKMNYANYHLNDERNVNSHQTGLRLKKNIQDYFSLPQGNPLTKYFLDLLHNQAL